MPSNRMSDKGMKLLMSIESFRDKPYDDQNGNAISNWVKGATIGYGHLISQDEWNRSGGDYQDGITGAQAQALFMQDLSPFVDGVNVRVTAALSQNQFDALVILAFNIGLGVNQHAKITRERVKSTLKSFHPMDEKIRHLVGEPWSDNNGTYSRNQAPTFH